MSLDITTLSGYDQKIYDDLAAQYTQRTGKSEAALQNELLALVDSGKSISEAMNIVSNELPALTPPIWEQDFTSYTAGALPSFGSNYMALITDIAAEQRKQTADQKALQTELLISNIEEQADNIRTKAALELTAGIISGATQIASGFFTAAKVSSGMKGATGDAFNGTAMTVSTKVQAQAGAIGGAGSIVSSAFSFGASMVEAGSKELEADAERIRATQDMLNRMDDALHELIQKSLSTQDAIQQNMNQTRQRILG